LEIEKQKNGCLSEMHSFYNLDSFSLKSEIPDIVFEIAQKEVVEDDVEINSPFDFYSSIILTEEDKISICNKVLFDVCCEYVTLANASIDVYPNNSLEFVNLILDTMEENSYKESFLLSIQFIYQNYFDYLGKGYPTLVSPAENISRPSIFQITLDSNHQILQFETINMDLIEQGKIMTKLVSMETRKEIGPLPKVLSFIRKDI